MMEVIGEPISPGITAGEVFLFRQIDLNALSKTKFTIDNTVKEVERLDATIVKTMEQLNSIIRQQELSATESDIFQVQLSLLEDGEFIPEIKAIVHSQKANIEFVLSNQIKSIESQFRAMDNEIMRTRVLDIQDMYYRLLRNCLEIEHVRSNPLKRVRSAVIFVAEKLLPSDIALIDHDKLLGIIIEEGSSVSHVAILAKALGIPAIIKVPGIATLVKTHDMIILDALLGKVIINPTEQVKARYKKKEKTYSARFAGSYSDSPALDCSTSDGVIVRLEANVGSIKEAREASAAGAQGIGLLRTELFYLSQAALPTIDKEFDYYREIISLSRNQPVTIRLLDVGADKNLPYAPGCKEENPQMGIRGIRFLLRNPDILTQHLRCILRAAALGPVRLLIPFVAMPADVKRLLDIVANVCKQESVDRNGFLIGSMIEIPSAALALNDFWPYVDFVTIGTNDLVQYIFAASREDGNVEEYRRTLHPVILGIIRRSVLSAARHNKDISLCGEIASDPYTAPLLVGLGLRRLSMQPASIPLVRKSIARHSLSDLELMAQKALVSKNL